MPEDIRYEECDTMSQIYNSLRKADIEWTKFKNDNPDSYCRIVISNHWASEGIWVEFKEIELSPEDFIYKDNSGQYLDTPWTTGKIAF